MASKVVLHTIESYELTVYSQRRAANPAVQARRAAHLAAAAASSEPASSSSWASTSAASSSPAAASSRRASPRALSPLRGFSSPVRGGRAPLPSSPPRPRAPVLAPPSPVTRREKPPWSSRGGGGEEGEEGGVDSTSTILDHRVCQQPAIPIDSTSI
jgi:hypothetical protein